MALTTLFEWFGYVLCILTILPSAQCRNCTKDDYKPYVTPCDINTQTRSIVYYLNTDCKGGVAPPAPQTNIPCDCPQGSGLSGSLSSTQCTPCEVGSYGPGGEIINNWKNWTKNGTVPPEGSGIVTFCEAERQYVQPCHPWKVSADEYTINSGDNSLTRCMSSVLLMTKKFVMSVSQVSFEYRVDSRNCRGPGYLGCDGLAFFVDNKELLTYSGNKFNWVNVTYNLTKGTHTLKWVYRKRCFSFGTYSYIDKAFIRSIMLVGNEEPDVRCKKCPPGFFGTKKNSASCTSCSYFQYQDKEGQSRCKTCPENTYAMPGASRCIPLLNCTSDDIIAAPGDVNSCSCEPSPNGFECNTTVKPEYIKVHVANVSDPRRLCDSAGNPSLNPIPYQCKCEGGFEIVNGTGGKLQCKPCETGFKSRGVKCETCEAGHVALPGKHYSVWRKDTLPKGFTANCVGDCAVKSGWIPSGHVIRTARVVGNVRTYLQSSEFTLDSELAKIAFNCSITCNVTGVSQKSMPGEHLANIQDCNLVFQVWSNNTIVDELNCTRPKGGYVYRHENRRDGRVIRHVYPLKKGRFSFRWVFIQQDETRMLSTAFEGKLYNISVLGVQNGTAKNCTACPAGYHSNLGNTDCTICPNGTSSPAGAKSCISCKEGTFAAAKGSSQCLPCGQNTKSLPGKDGCDTNNCMFKPADDVVYDLSKLSRPGGPMIEALFYRPSLPWRPRRLSIWPYPRAIYFNLCTLDHDNSSCVYRNRVTRVHTPRPVMSCRSSWFTYDTDLGSVIGYRKKSDVKSGLFVDLLNGDKCYQRYERNTRYQTILDLRCDVRAGVGNPAPENNYTSPMRGGCKFYFVWKSLYACPKCRDSDVNRIIGECINGMRNVTYVRKVPCWRPGNDSGLPTTNATEKCETPTSTVIVTVKVKENGTVAYQVLKENKANIALIGVGVVIIVILVGVAAFFVYKHRALKYRYYGMLARNKPMSRLEEEDESNFIHDDELAQPFDEMSPSVKT